MIELYTQTHPRHLLERIGKGQFTAQEHEFVSREQFSEILASKDRLLHWFLSKNLRRFGALAFLIERIQRSNYRRVVSLGAGFCVLEYYLKVILGEQIEVTATDFDAYYVSKSREFFPELRSETFDFFNDDVNVLGRQDIAVFFGSAYVMNDAQFVSLFEGLRRAGVQEIVDFHGGFFTWKMLIHQLVKKRSSQGKFHGYGRNQLELRRLYKRAGLRVVQTLSSVPTYKFVAVLK